MAKGKTFAAFGSTGAFGSRTDVGLVRQQNEDSLIVAPPLFVVADGMGGHAAGEVASEIAVATIAECTPETLDVEKLGAAVEVANREIINAALSGKGRDGMGTTCTAAMMEGSRLIVAQVGDSRAYLLHGGKLSQLTRDHSLMANMIEAGQITLEEARYHPQRSVITRALGSDIDTVPDLYEVAVAEGDRLLLCSDGLSSLVRDDRIQALMICHKDPQECASALVDEALAAGGTDNVTVIVADVEGSAPKRRRRLAKKTKITVGVILGLLVALIAGAVWGGWTYLHNAAYLAEGPDGHVQVYRGVPGSVMGLSYSELVETTDVPVADLSPTAAESIAHNMRVGSLDEAMELVDSYRSQRNQEEADAARATSEGAAEPSAAAPDSDGAAATQEADR